MDVNQVVKLLVDRAEQLECDPDDSNGLVRVLVESHGLSFYAWFCVCCELADRKARKEGYEHAVDRAYKLASQRTL